jgi:hypothetical protein
MVETKICSTCKQSKALEEFTRDKSKKDGLKTSCRKCVADSRSASTLQEKRAIAAHKKHLEACRRTLENPAASDLQRRNSERDLRLSAKHLERILKPFNDARAEVAACEAAAKNAEQNAKDAITQAEQDRLYDARKLEEERIAAAIKDQADRDIVAGEKAAAEIMEWVRPYLLTPCLEIAKREKLKTHCTTQAIACHKVEKSEKGMDASGANKSAIAARMAQTFEHLAKRLEIITEDSVKSLPEKYFLGFSCSPENWAFRDTQERALLREQTVLVYNASGISMESLPDAPPAIRTAPRPAQSLDGIESMIEAAAASREWLQQRETERQAYWSKLKADDLKRYELESKEAILQVKGSGPLEDNERNRLRELKKLDPAAYERESLMALLPRNYEPQNLVYLVPTHSQKDVEEQARFRKTGIRPKRLPQEMWWPHGVQVRPNVEIFYDFILKGWYRTPEPIDADADFGTNAKKECVFDEMQNKWVYRTVEEGVEHYQDAAGNWVKRTSSANFFAKPNRITFVNADRRSTPDRTEFRHGHWYTPTEIEAAGKAMSDGPVLPPLPRVSVADNISIAKERPLSDEEIRAMDRPVETTWQRSSRLRAEEAARSQEILN